MVGTCMYDHSVNILDLGSWPKQIQYSRTGGDRLRDGVLGSR